MSEFETVALASSFPLVGALTIRVQGRKLALFRVGEVFHALDNECPHKGGPLAQGTVENGVVHCPLHGWGFNLATGACLDNPARPVRRHDVRVLGDDIQVRITPST